MAMDAGALTRTLGADERKPAAAAVGAGAERGDGRTFRSAHLVGLAGRTFRPSRRRKLLGGVELRQPRLN
jgi:hypothetical protein